MAHAPQPTRVAVGGKITYGVEHHLVGRVKFCKNVDYQRGRVHRRAAAENVVALGLPVRAGGGLNGTGLQV